MKDFLIFAKCERFSYCLTLNTVIFLSYLQVCLEGQISRKSAIRSLSDGYQPSGDQIPWKFCEQFQDTVFPGLSGARIVRIATHPGVMRVSLFIKHGKLCWFFHILVSLYFYINIFICVYLLQSGYGSQAVELLARYVMFEFLPVLLSWKMLEENMNDAHLLYMYRMK